MGILHLQRLVVKTHADWNEILRPDVKNSERRKHPILFTTSISRLEN